MKLVIDRFEGDLVVCEDLGSKEIITLKKDTIPYNAKEGTLLDYDGNHATVDEGATAARTKKIKAKMDDLWI